jgi:hypothetical protein
MAIISQAELTARASDAFLYRTFEVLLLNNEGEAYTSLTTYEDILADELQPSMGGYGRIEITYSEEDLEDFSGGISAFPVVLNFIHDGSQEPMVFNNVALVERDDSFDTPTYRLVAIQSLGLGQALATQGEIARVTINSRFKTL